jgi:hypothetical protein
MIRGVRGARAVTAIVGSGALLAAALRPGDVVVVDVHSHTKHSHDGRPGWEAEDVRAWHAASGYDAAYITDHRSYRGAEEGVAANPTVAGQGTVLLSGLEVVYGGERVNLLSAGRVYRGLTTENLWDIDTLALALGSLLQGREPVLVQTIPARLERMRAERDVQYETTEGRSASGEELDIDRAMCRNTAVSNLTGLPALALPSGFEEGLPVGVQLFGRRWDEARVLEMGQRIAEALDLPGAAVRSAASVDSPLASYP